MIQQKKCKKLTLEEIQQVLKERNVNLSYQRLNVMEALLYCEGHPSADQIYRDLQKKKVTLSKATVYNTLRLLVEAGVVREITIENDEVRYDVVTENHGHFKCQICGRIYNFDIDPEAMIFHGLDRFHIQQRDVYFKGTCPGCLSNKNNTKEE